MESSPQVDQNLATLAKELSTLHAQIAGQAERKQTNIRAFLLRNRELIEQAIAGVAALRDDEREALYQSHDDLSLPAGSFPAYVDHLFDEKLLQAGLLRVRDDHIDVLRRVVAYAKYVVDTTGTPSARGNSGVRRQRPAVAGTNAVIAPMDSPVKDVEDA